MHWQYFHTASEIYFVLLLEYCHCERRARRIFSVFKQIAQPVNSQHRRSLIAHVNLECSNDEVDAVRPIESSNIGVDAVLSSSAASRLDFRRLSMLLLRITAAA